ncbi:hypothetical protein HRH25_04515 [Flavisolibacter sp. BT320]|nr:hypothetical protein [Flavisolibacter longurius]
MKQLLILIVAIVSGISFFQCNQADAKKRRQDRALTPIALDKAVEGTWKLVWQERNNERSDMDNHIQVKMFTGGTFFLYAHDTAGTMKFSGYGRYGFEGDQYHETFLYHSHRPYWGAMDWQYLEVKGDTMYMNGFSKMVVEGKEMTEGWPKIKEKLVKVAW